MWLGISRKDLFRKVNQMESILKTSVFKTDVIEDDASNALRSPWKPESLKIVDTKKAKPKIRVLQHFRKRIKMHDLRYKVGLSL